MVVNYALFGAAGGWSAHICVLSDDVSANNGIPVPLRVLSREAGGWSAHIVSYFVLQSAKTHITR
jgi:hypothetical protein